ncbi:MAG: oxidoreductase [Bacteroidetes bacterium]|nr:MAG: oxidoreductase [Bacteroidota bacterium]
MSSDNIIKFAVVGCGHIGKRHANMIFRNPDAELVAICDIRSKDELKLGEIDVPVFTSLDELFQSNVEVDVINVCTANGLHAEHSLYALSNNKHVVVEKPLGLHTDNCKAVIAKSKEVGRHVFCVMQNRFSPPSIWIKKVIDDSLLGDIYMVQLNCFWNRDDRYYKKGGWKGTIEMDGGTLFTQFSHYIDMMYWLFGDITDIKGKFHNYRHQESTEFEDSGIVNFSFVNGGLGSFNYSTAVWDKNIESTITIIGSKGSVKLGGQYMEEVQHCHIDNYEIPELPELSTKHDYGDYKGAAANHHFIIENVIDTLNGKTEISINAEDGLKVVDIIERMYQQRT